MRYDFVSVPTSQLGYVKDGMIDEQENFIDTILCGWSRLGSSEAVRRLIKKKKRSRLRLKTGFLSVRMHGGACIIRKGTHKGTLANSFFIFIWLGITPTSH
jgi:hypothetical protein